MIATKKQKPELEGEMIKAIQQAYYLQAKNPSDEAVLIDLAQEICLNVEQFMTDFRAPSTQSELLRHIRLSQAMGVQSFPSLMLKNDANSRLIKIDYHDASKVLQQPCYYVRFPP